MFVNTTTYFLRSEYDKVRTFFENISLQPKLSNILIFQTFKKCGFLSENHKLKIFEEVSTLVEYSIHHPNFFLNSKLTFKHFYFLNHVNSTKIEKNIYPSDPPPKTPILGGGSDTLDGLDFGYVSRRMISQSIYCINTVI